MSIITIFVLCDEYLQACKHKEAPQCKVSDAEVMTTVAVFSRQYSISTLYHITRVKYYENACLIQFDFSITHHKYRVY